VIDPTTSPQYFGGTTTASSGTPAPKNTMDENAFMKLLVAQLGHQDPMNPMDSSQMASQLAQFTSVEQLTQLNTAMATQTQATQVATLASQSALSASLIGRQIEAAGNQVVVPSTGQGEILVDIGGTGGTGTLTLTDSTGAKVATRDLGPLKPGLGEVIQLPTDLPPGSWHYSLDVTDSNNNKSTVTTYSSGVVTGVEYKNGDIVLQAGGLELSLSDLVRIAPAPGPPIVVPPTVTGPKPDLGQRNPLGPPTLPGPGLDGSAFTN